MSGNRQHVPRGGGGASEPCGQWRQHTERHEQHPHVLWCRVRASSRAALRAPPAPAGEGPSPVKGAKIQAHYTGKLMDGKVFDSSYQRGQPLAFNVGVGMVRPESSARASALLLAPAAACSAQARQLCGPRTQVISGWDMGILGDEAQGIPAMKQGGKRKVRVGARGTTSCNICSPGFCRHRAALLLGRCVWPAAPKCWPVCACRCARSWSSLLRWRTAAAARAASSRPTRRCSST